ncbi:MAG: protein TolQ [Holosporales bacterium]|jgi:biopolymer transport protein TolQ|nr:protein TolQ [Holosporales bacterium]
MENSQITQGAEDVIGNVPSADITVSGTITQVQAPHDSSFLDMFWHAGFMIKIVVIFLLFASIWSWAIILSKYFKLKRLSIDADTFEENFWSGIPLDALYKDLKNEVFDPISNIFCAAMSEWERFASKPAGSGGIESKILERRMDRVMQIAIRKEVDEIEKGLGFLSSIGTNGVIIGLFGTVIGILEGFKAIALQQSTSIATVAPVISEALFTTALGIITAIPAALAYNKFMNDTNRYINRLETFADEFSSIIARQFDE